MLPRELLLDLGYCKRVAEVQGQRGVVVPVPWAVHMALEVIQLPFVPLIVTVNEYTSSAGHTKSLESQEECSNNLEIVFASVRVAYPYI